jgi:hypothetical protein
LAQEVTDSAEHMDEAEPHISKPLPVHHARFSFVGIIVLLVLISILILSSTSLLLPNLIQVFTHQGLQIAKRTPSLRIHFLFRLRLPQIRM